MIYSIDLSNQTATAMNGVCFKLTETEPGVFKGVCIIPDAIPPDDMDEKILARMIKEAGDY